MAAPKGNKFAIGNSGTQKYYESPEELEKYINEYFERCDSKPIKEQQWVGKEGVEVLKNIPRPYTIEGLCLHLKITRQTLLNYSKKEGYEVYFDIITRAKMKITDQHVTYGLAGQYNANLVKFNLSNNADYKDKSEMNISTDQPMMIKIGDKEVEI